MTTPTPTATSPVDPAPPARPKASPESLPSPGDAPDREMLEQFLSQWPGGEHILPHADEGPWHLTAVSTWDGATWRIREALAGYPPLAQLKIRGWDGNPEERLVFAVPAFPRALMEWEDLQDGFTLDWELDVPAFRDQPGLTELADVMPTWMGFDAPAETMEAMRASFRQTFSTIGPAATMELIAENDPEGTMTEDEALTLLRALQHPHPS